MPTAIEIHQRAVRFSESLYWPGYSFTTTPIAIYDGTETRLFNAPSALSGFEPDPDNQNEFFCRDKHPEASSTTARPIDGTIAAILSRDNLPNPEMVEDLEYLAAIAVHEAFHVYQLTCHNEWCPPIGLYFKYPREDSESLKLRYLEIEALSRALSSSNQFMPWIKRAILTREQRAVCCPKATEIDSQLEVFEGVPYQIELLLRGRTNVDESIMTEIALPGQFNRQGYCAGALYSLAASRIDRTWPEILERSPLTSLPEVVSQVVDLNQIEPAQFENIDEITADVKAKNAISRLPTNYARFAQQASSVPGWTLVVIGNPVLQPEWYDPLQCHWWEGQMVHTRFLHLKAAWGEIVVDGRFCMTSSNDLTDPICGGVERVIIHGLPPISLANHPQGHFRYEDGSMQVDVKFGWHKVNRQMVLLRVIP